MEFDLHMDGISPSNIVSERKPPLFLEKTVKTSNKELMKREECMRDQENKFVAWVDKERKESERAMEEKAGMIRELTQEVYSVMNENHQLKKELQKTLKEIQKERKANELILEQRSQKEKEAFVCFSAALQAKNRVLDKLGQELENKKGELEQLKKVADAQKIEFKTSVDILEEKRRNQIEHKENEIRHLIVRMNSVTENSRRSSTPANALHGRFTPISASNLEKKKKFAQKQAEDMCQLMQTQTENHVMFVQQTEKTVAQLSENNHKLKGEVKELKKELERGDKIIRSYEERELAETGEEEIARLQDNYQSLTKHGIMEMIKHNIYVLLRDVQHQNDEINGEELINFVQEMSSVLQQFKQKDRELSGSNSEASFDGNETEELSKKREVVNESLRSYMSLSWIENNAMNEEEQEEIGASQDNNVRAFTLMHDQPQITPTNHRPDQTGVPPRLSSDNDFKIDNGFDDVVEGVLSYLKAKITLMEKDNSKIKNAIEQKNMRLNTNQAREGLSGVENSAVRMEKRNMTLTLEPESMQKLNGTFRNLSSSGNDSGICDTPSPSELTSSGYFL